MRRRSAQAVALLLACAANGCRSTLDLDEYSFEALSASCESGAVRCDGDAVQACVAGAWSAPEACPEAQPVCNAGQCATLRLRGGLGGLGGPGSAAPGSASGLRVRGARMDTVVRSCSARLDVCVRGQIAP